MGKRSVSRLSYLFAHLYLLSSDPFSSHLLSSNLPLLSASPLLCFSSVHIVGSLTSKLPSVKMVPRCTTANIVANRRASEDPCQRIENISMEKQFNVSSKKRWFLPNLICFFNIIIMLQEIFFPCESHRTIVNYCVWGLLLGFVGVGWS